MIARWIAIWQVYRRRAERIVAPGKWKVWREGDAVRHQVLSKE